MSRTAAGPRRRIGTEVLLAASLLGLAGCSGANPDDLPTDPGTWLEVQDGLEAEEPVEATADEPAISAAELLEEPSNFVGEAVAVEAVVDRVLVPGAFTLTAEGAGPDGSGPGEEDGLRDGAIDLEEDAPPEEDVPDLPVLAADGAFVAIGPTEEISAGETVLVTGVVQSGLDSSDLDQTYPEGWPDGALDEFVDGPWLQVATVEPVGG